jgi:hypothetical protein
MEPSNDHEGEIARIIDQLSLKDKLDPDWIAEVVVCLSFRLSKPECQFLVNYIRWRTENPIKEETA